MFERPFDGCGRVRFRAEVAVSPSDQAKRWCVVNSELQIHVQASSYLAGLRARDSSPNTERVYAGRLALYLNFCADHGVDWSTPTFVELHKFMNWLVDEPLPPKSVRSVQKRYRSKGTANAIMTTTCEFLRFGCLHGWVPDHVPGLLSQPRYLRYVPQGYEAGEDDQYRTVNVRTIKFASVESAPEAYTPAQIDELLSCSLNSRDRFLVRMLLQAGPRIGEALGTRREDLHFLSNSEVLGCSLAGPHFHVQRRMNSNGALAKSRFPRALPVDEGLVSAYADYCFDRDRVAAAAENDHVFVNLYRQPFGQPMTYWNVIDLCERLTGKCGFLVRPHKFRHTAATEWLRAGVDPDVVQALMGHVTFASTAIYLHASHALMREAVDRVAAAR